MKSFRSVLYKKAIKYYKVNVPSSLQNNSVFGGLDAVLDYFFMLYFAVFLS